MGNVCCIFCAAENSPDCHVCGSCGRRLVLGRLTSLGTGVLPRGFVWELRPGTLTLGRDVGNDFVIPSNLLAGQQLRFAWADDSFVVENLTGSDDCCIDEVPIVERAALRDGDMLQVGVEQFAYQYLPPGLELSPPAAAGGAESVTEQLQLMLGIVAEFQASQNLQELLDGAVDAALRISRTRRGWAFFVERTMDGTPDLRLVAARGDGDASHDDRAAEFATLPLIREAFAGRGTILVHDGLAEGNAGPTMICLPLMAFDPRRGERRVMGLVYAEDPAPVSPIPASCRPNLQLLCHLVTSTVVRWRDFDRARTHMRSCQRAVSTLRNDLNDLTRQVQLLLQRTDEPERVQRLNREDLRLDLQTMYARLDSARASLQRLAAASDDH